MLLQHFQLGWQQLHGVGSLGAAPSDFSTPSSPGQIQYWVPAVPVVTKTPQGGGGRSTVSLIPPVPCPHAAGCKAVPAQLLQLTEQGCPCHGKVSHWAFWCTLIVGTQGCCPTQSPSSYATAPTADLMANRRLRGSSNFFSNINFS